MRLKELTFALVILLSSFQFGFSQEWVEEENWIGVIEGFNAPRLYHQYGRFTKEDVTKAKQILNSIKQSEPKDEWEGSYSRAGELSEIKFIWNSNVGFIDYYIYTCTIVLRRLNYGKVINNSDSVILITEKPLPSNAKASSKNQRKLIKVTWGNKHFLVDETDLETFAELTAGYYGQGKIEKIKSEGETYEVVTSIWNSFWIKSDELSNKVFGLPVFPKQYEKFIKHPIETKIASIGKYEKDKPTNEPVMTYSRQYVNIGLGKNNGIKLDMQFYVYDLDERLTITKVMNNSSVGVLERWIDSDTHKEMCSSKGDNVPCKSPKAGMKIKTIPDEFLEDN